MPKPLNGLSPPYAKPEAWLPDRVALDDDARHARLRQVVGGGHARDAAAHDHNVSRALSHRPKILPKSMRPVKPRPEPAVVMVPAAGYAECYTATETYWVDLR